jgi:hypothetical protein
VAFSQGHFLAAPNRRFPGRDGVGVEPTFITKVVSGPVRLRAALEPAHAQDRASHCRQAADRVKAGMGRSTGLAPVRAGLKGRALELLCIHGQILATGVGPAPTPPGLRPGAQTLYAIQ